MEVRGAAVVQILGLPANPSTTFEASDCGIGFSGFWAVVRHFGRRALPAFGREDYLAATASKVVERTFRPMRPRIAYDDMVFTLVPNVARIFL